MKTTILKLTAILLCFAGSFACEDKETNSYQNNIIGKWALVAWYNDIPLDINNDGNVSTDLMSQWEGCFKHSILEFSNNFNYVKIIYTGTDNNPKCPPDFKTNSFSIKEPWNIINNNVLRFIGDDYLDEYPIIELSDKILILKGSGFITCCDESISYYEGGYLKFNKIE